MLQIKYPIFLIVFTLKLNYAKHECFLPVDINADISKQPLYFVGNNGKYELAIPQMNNERFSVVVKHLDKIKLACSTSDNSVNIYDYTYEGKCKGGKLKWQSVLGKLLGEKLSGNIACQKSHRFSVRHTQEYCYKSQGKIYEIGILYNLRNKKDNSYRIFTSKSEEDLPTWYAMATICHDENTLHTKYTKHVLYGESIRFRQKIKTEKDYYHNLDRISYNFNRSYKQQYDNNESTQAEDTEYENSETKLYVPTQLVPAEDMLTLNWYHSTYSHMNVIPMWYFITCTWHVLENEIRRNAALMNVPLAIYTGSFAPSQYPQGDNPRPPFNFEVSQDSLIALSYWKIVINEDTSEGIAFLLQNVIHNKIFIKSGIDCATYGWVFNQFVNFTGVISCWKISDFGRRWNLPEIDGMKITQNVLRGYKDVNI